MDVEALEMATYHRCLDSGVKQQDQNINYINKTLSPLFHAAQRTNKEERARNAVAKMAPRPPRNLKVIAKACDHVGKTKKCPPV